MTFNNKNDLFSCKYIGHKKYTIKMFEQKVGTFEKKKKQTQIE